MRTEIKERLEEVVTLLNDSDEVVLDQEVKQKLEKVLSLLSNPDKSQVAKQLNFTKPGRYAIKVS